MDLWTPEMTQLLVSTAITILVPYLIYAAERYLKVRLDEAARATLDTGDAQRRRLAHPRGPAADARRRCWSTCIAPRRMRSRAGSSTGRNRDIADGPGAGGDRAGAAGGGRADESAATERASKA